jgi:IS5 family transposase
MLDSRVGDVERKEPIREDEGIKERRGCIGERVRSPKRGRNKKIYIRFCCERRTKEFSKFGKFVLLENS